jgi:hypothetical protein
MTVKVPTFMYTMGYGKAGHERGVRPSKVFEKAVQIEEQQDYCTQYTD